MMEILEGGRPLEVVSARRRTPDQLESGLLTCEAAIGRLRAHQAELLRELREIEIHHVDGARSMKDWTAARLDVSHDTARALLTAARAGQLLEDVSFDRAVATARLIAAGGDEEAVEWSRRFDIARVRRMTGHYRRITRVSEQKAHESQHFRVYGNFDKSMYHTSGAFAAPGGRTVELFFQQLTDDLPATKGERRTREQRQADALVALAEDYLGSRRPDSNKPVGVLNVFVDAATAGDTGGETGGEIEFGPRIGPMALEQLLCGARIRVIVQDEDRTQVVASHAVRQIPSQVRARVAKRDGGCTIDGCSSRYRLEPHHIIPWAMGGSHEPDNLTTLCWYHHHVAIHQRGRELDPDSPPGRRRFLARRRRAPPVEAA
jgi:hypothetical protein